MADHWIPDGEGGFIKENNSGMVGIVGLLFLGGLILISPFLLGAGVSYLSFILIFGAKPTISASIALLFHTIIAITLLILSTSLYLIFLNQLTTSHMIFGLLAIVLVTISPAASFDYFYDYTQNFGQQAPIDFKVIGPYRADGEPPNVDFFRGAEFSITNLGNNDISFRLNNSCTIPGGQLDPDTTINFSCLYASRGKTGNGWSEWHTSPVCIIPNGYRQTCLNVFEQ